MGQYSLLDFAARAERDFTVDGIYGATLRLARVVPLQHSPREGGGFRLELEGPAEPVLAQGTYTLREGGEDYEIFLVAVARNADGRIAYEAIFN